MSVSKKEPAYRKPATYKSVSLTPLVDRLRSPDTGYLLTLSRSTPPVHTHKTWSLSASGAPVITAVPNPSPPRYLTSYTSLSDTYDSLPHNVSPACFVLSLREVMSSQHTLDQKTQKYTSVSGDFLKGKALGSGMTRPKRMTGVEAKSAALRMLISRCPKPARCLVPDLREVTDAEARCLWLSCCGDVEHAHEFACALFDAKVSLFGRERRLVERMSKEVKKVERWVETAEGWTWGGGEGTTEVIYI